MENLDSKKIVLNVLYEKTFDAESNSEIIKFDYETMISTFEETLSELVCSFTSDFAALNMPDFVFSIIDTPLKQNLNVNKIPKTLSIDLSYKNVNDKIMYDYNDIVQDLEDIINKLDESKIIIIDVEYED